MRVDKIKNHFVVAALAIARLSPGVSAGKVKKVVSEICNVPVSELENLRNRHFDVVLARHLCYKVYRENNDKVSLTKMGKDFGGYKHTTVMHGIKTVNNRIETNEKVRELHKCILKKLNT